jgi:hypothetical protein
MNRNAGCVVHKCCLQGNTTTVSLESFAFAVGLSFGVPDPWSGVQLSSAAEAGADFDFR